MLLSEPNTTPYDIRFNLGRIPVRIHPAFFILPVFWGASTGSGVGVIIFTIVFFLSILVHELGHALMMMRFRESPRIVLYWMGGLAIADGMQWGGFARRNRPRTEFENILICLAGPVAGLLLAAVGLGIFRGMGATVEVKFYGLPWFQYGIDGTQLESNQNLFWALFFLVYINVYLNLLNLAPVYPLDGGQIARSLFVHFDPWRGIQNSLWLSLIVAVLIALAFGASRQQFAMIFFAVMAIQNFQSIQMSGRGGFGGGRPW